LPVKAALGGLALGTAGGDDRLSETESIPDF